jgi:hypothetical protein
MANSKGKVLKKLLDKQKRKVPPLPLPPMTPPPIGPAAQPPQGLSPAPMGGMPPQQPPMGMGM